MADALHGLRAIERQFGRIRDYRLLRDSEIRSEYQAICWAAFESPKSLLRVPPKGTTLKVELPHPLGRPEGGLGLDDIKDLLVPDGRSKLNPPNPQADSSKPARFITLNIKRAAAPISFRSTVRPPFRSRAMKAAIGHAFVEWGGFAPLEPLHTSSPFTSPAVDLPPPDNINMRMALNKWSQILGIADPLFPEMKQGLNETRTLEKDTGSETEWEPLSEPAWQQDAEASVVKNSEMARGKAQESLKQSLEGLLQRSPATKIADNKAN